MKLTNREAEFKELIEIFNGMLTKYSALNSYPANRILTYSSYEILYSLVKNNTFVYIRDIDLIFKVYSRMVRILADQSRDSKTRLDFSLTKVMANTGTIKVKLDPSFKLFLEDLSKFFILDTVKPGTIGIDKINNGSESFGTDLWESLKSNSIERIDYYLASLHDKTVELFKALEKSDFTKVASIKEAVSIGVIENSKNMRYVYTPEYEFSMLVSKSSMETIGKILLILLCNILITLTNPGVVNIGRNH